MSGAELVTQGDYTPRRRQTDHDNLRRQKRSEPREPAGRRPDSPPASAGSPRPVSGARRAAIEGDSGTALLAYASSWFTYHAGQRQQSFDFFIALQTALVVVVSLQYGTASWGTLVIFGAVGVADRLLFTALEIRNTELVLAAGATLAGLETSFHDGAGGQAAAISAALRCRTRAAIPEKAFVEFLTLKDVNPIGCRPDHRRRYKALGFVIRNGFVLGQAGQFGGSHHVLTLRRRRHFVVAVLCRAVHGQGGTGAGGP